MPLFFADEDATLAHNMLRQAEHSKEKLLAPTLWFYEFGNVLTTARRRDRITPDQLDTICELTRHLPIEVATQPTLSEIHHQTLVARQFDLTFYDAAYLTLAAKACAALATHDRKLARAAAQHHIPLI